MSHSWNWNDQPQVQQQQLQHYQSTLIQYKDALTVFRLFTGRSAYGFVLIFDGLGNMVRQLKYSSSDGSTFGALWHGRRNNLNFFRLYLADTDIAGINVAVINILVRWRRYIIIGQIYCLNDIYPSNSLLCCGNVVFLFLQQHVYCLQE